MADITAEIHTPTIQAEVYRATLPAASDGKEVEIGNGLKLEDNVLSVDTDKIADEAASIVNDTIRGESPVIVKATVNRDKGTFELVNCSFSLLKEMYDKGYTLFLVADTIFDDCPIKTCAKIVYVDDETFQFSQIIADTERGVSTSYTFIVISEGKNEYIESEITIPTDYVTPDMLEQAIRDYDNDVMSLLGSDEE